MPRKPDTLTQKLLHDLLEYDAERGVFIRKIKTAPCVEVGDIAGGMGDYGYPQVSVNGRQYKSHRLAWFYVYGEWPKEIDHIDGDRANFRFANLRKATRRQNTHNAGLRKDSTSGFKGVKYDGLVEARPWSARIHVNGVENFLGYYADERDAASAYDGAARKYFSEFAKLNFPESSYVPPSHLSQRNIRNTSGFIGVHLQGGRWISRLTVGKTRMLLGSFDNPYSAAYAYDSAALKHGTKHLNFPGEGPS